jgi:CHAT domain-containing protein/predicted RNA binding protein YcfA (HicA-like mRNA interferase family)/tetratricopeptide (TPR) repeat protein
MGKASRRKKENRTWKGAGNDPTTRIDVATPGQLFQEIQAAVQLKRQGNYTLAYQNYQSLDTRYPNNPIVLSSWAKTAASQGSFEEAIRLFERAQSLYKEYGDEATWWQCGEHIKQLMEADDSAEFLSYMRAVSGNPDWTYPQRYVQSNNVDLVLGIDKILSTMPMHSDFDSENSLWVTYFMGKRNGSNIFKDRTSKKVELYDKPFIVDVINTNLITSGWVDDYLNILPLQTGYAALFISLDSIQFTRDKKSTYYFCHLKHQDDKFVVSKKLKIVTNRFLDFWQWAYTETNASGKEIIFLSGYDPDDDAIILYDTASGLERRSRDFVVNRKIHDLRNEHRSKQIAVQVCNEENPTYVGEYHNISVLFFRKNRKYVAVDLTSKTILWTEDVEESFYSSIYRGMLVSAREEYVEVRDIETGRIIAKTELLNENSWCYVKPIVFGGNLYLSTDDNCIWEIDIPNKIDSIDLKGNTDYKLHFEDEKGGEDTEHPSSDEMIMKKLITCSEMMRNAMIANSNSGFRCENVFQVLSDSYYRCRPVVNNDTMFLYNLNENANSRKRSRSICIFRLKPNYVASAVRWLMKRLDVTAFANIASNMGNLGDVNGVALFERSLSRALFRCRDYYEDMKQKAFIDVYCLSAIEVGAFSEIDPRVRFVSVEVAYSEIYASILNTFAYSKDFPNFHELFFSDRTELADLLQVDFDRSIPIFPQEKLSERGRYVFQEISEAGGLGQLEALGCTSYTSVMEKISNLPSGDKACILEHDYFCSKHLHRARARETGLALFQAGKAARALYYLFMSNCLPETYVDYNTSTMMPLMQAICQLIYFSGGESKASLLRRVDKNYIFEVDGLPQDFNFFFGLPLGGERLLRRFEVISQFVSEKRTAEANELVHQAVIELENYLSQHENEKLQVGTLMQIYEETIPRLISLNIDNNNTVKAFQIYEGFKALIMRRYLSNDNRKALLDRLQDERFYKELRNRKAKMVNGVYGERSGVLLHEDHPMTQNDQRFSLFAENHGTSTVDIIGLLKSLPANTAIVEYCFEDNRYGAFIAKNNDTCPKYVQFYDYCEEKYLDEMEGFTEAITNPSRDINRILVHLKGMYNKLIKPIEANLVGCKQLIIVPTKYLFRCPFTALYNGKNYLIENYDVSISPSASIYLICAKNQCSSMYYLTLVKGDDEQLPGIVQEETFFKKRFGHNLNVVTSYPPPSDVMRKTELLHFSGHGTFDDNEPLLSRIQVGRDDSISVLDLYSLDMSNVSIAVVNACVSGMTRVEAVDDIFGLVRGFFTAGCPTVVNTLWNLPDKVAPVFAESFYSDLLVSEKPLTSFSRSIRKIIHSDEFNSPKYWACYQYYGKGGVAPDRVGVAATKEENPLSVGACFMQECEQLDGVIDLEIRVVRRNDELLANPRYRGVLDGSDAQRFLLVETAGLLLPLSDDFDSSSLEDAVNEWLSRLELVTRGVTYSAREVTRKLKRLGYREKSTEGSHAHFISDERKGKVTVPVHGGEIRKGTLKSILNQAGIDLAKFAMA